MKEFLEYVLRQLVEFPEEVIVVELPRDKSVVFRIQARQTDIGKIIGAHGRTIAALRNLLSAAASRTDRKAHIEILEERPPAR